MTPGDSAATPEPYKLLGKVERIAAELAEARERYARAQAKAKPANDAVSRAFISVHNLEDELRQAKIALAQALDIGANGGALSVGVGGQW